MVSNTKIKAVGFYRKTIEYLSESLFSDAVLTIIAVSLIFLIGLGLNDYLSVSNKSSVKEFLRIDFNISFPALSCELASVDIIDVSGTNGLNITKTIRKYSIDSNSNPTKVWSEPKNEQSVDEEDGKDSVVLNAENFDRISKQHAILVVKFYAPWCYWSKRLKPSWEETARIMKERYDPEIDGRILLGEVDCTEESDLCRRHHIQGYPSMLIFRNGSDLIVDNSTNLHLREAYYGDRDTESLVTAMEDLVAPIPLQTKRTSESPDESKEPVAFRIEVSLLVKKNYLDITKTIRKYSTDSNSNPTEFGSEPIEIVTKNEQRVDEEDGKGSVVLNAENFDRISKQHAILVVKFYAPWCPWSKRMKPSWEETARIMKERYDPEIDGRILLGEVDCTEESDLCQRHRIEGYPSVRIFRKGSDLITNRVDNFRNEPYHEAYYGDRDTKSLVKEMEDLVAQIPLQWRQKRSSSFSTNQLAALHFWNSLKRHFGLPLVSTLEPTESLDTIRKGDTKEPVACRIEGSLLVKKVPLKMIISTRSATTGTQVYIQLKAKAGRKFLDF